MRWALAASAVALAAALAGCSGTAPAPARPAAPAPKAAHGRYLGVSVPGNPVSMPGVEKFAAVTGTHPDLVSYYTSWYSTFDASGTAAIRASGALPLIFLDSGRIPLSQVSGGNDDWLTSYAKAVAKYGHPVALSFDSEFNGPWWPWSYSHVSAAQFTAAWRRVVTVFRQAGAANVTWIWTVSVSSPVTTALKPWWPGSAYVNWIGVNGYLSVPGATFSNVFGPTFAQVSTVTSDPILITETGADPASDRPKAIASLFAGAESTPGVLGLVYFDYDKPSAHGANHNWLIDNDPAALAAFRDAAKEYGQ
jgi:mannan endo-1,4-beta-mannosidase